MVDALVMTGGGGLIVIVREPVPVPPKLVAVKLTDEVPAVVGVPEMIPVPEFNPKPVGSIPVP